MAQEPRLGWITIRSVDPPATITARLGADRPNVTQGYGGWTEVVRPQRSVMTVWSGSPSLRMDVSILLDGWGTGTSVERECSALERLGFPSASDGWPPRITIAAPGAQVPHQRLPWVIDTLTWGDALANKKGNRVRQQVTLSLLEYVSDVRVGNDSPTQLQQLKAMSAKAAQGGARKRIVAARARGTTYKPGTPGTVVAGFFEGDDLLSIAAKELGDAKRWPEIAKLNGIRDPRAIVPGQVIRIP